MEANHVRALLAATPDKLERVAKQLELPLPIARDIRVQAMNLVLGRCVLCGKPTLAGLCGHCKKGAPHRRMIPWSAAKFLKLLKPADQLLRQKCDQCGHVFMLSAKYLLRRLFSRDKGELKHVCGSCLTKKRREAEAKKREEEYRQRREEEAAALARALKMREHLFHRPFEADKGLRKLRVELATQKHAKRPQKGQNSEK